MKQAWDSLVAFKLVWVRVLLYFLLPSGGAFLIAAKDLTDEKWQAIGIIGHIRFCIEVVIPGALALAAFIDTSLPRKREEIEAKRRDDQTRQFYKEGSVS